MAFGCSYFMQNNELLCRIQQGFDSTNFVNISCDQQLTPNRTSLGAKLRRKVAISGKHRLILPQAANYVNIDCDRC